MLINRTMSTKLKSLATQFPIITLTGARQSGKTTLSQELFKDFEHVTLEDPAIRDLATHGMRSFLNRYNNHVIFDETQRVPELFSALQGIVDDRGDNGQFVLTSSQNFLLMNTISQSLAGRVAVMYLLPLSYTELSDAGCVRTAWMNGSGVADIHDCTSIPSARSTFIPVMSTPTSSATCETNRAYAS
ncbi:ATP-binding protein [Bifidobacterium miconis]|uniref:ATP-binding protein n=1 Tax=Bifidobacterium miconis TaxID=2834435 RepID=UPI001F1F1758|nr:AAA family ATPase [Bifidobacterium miconis]